MSVDTDAPEAVTWGTSIYEKIWSETVRSTYWNGWNRRVTAT